jgi:predicted enzyme related to lactoylglutathione lyase
MDMGPMGVYQMFGRAAERSPEGQHGMPMGGLFPKPPQMEGPPAWLHYARVPDVNAAVEATSKNGGQVINGPMEVPGGDMIAQIVDPQGAMFAVHEVKSEG